MRQQPYPRHCSRIESHSYLGKRQPVSNAEIPQSNLDHHPPASLARLVGNHPLVFDPLEVMRLPRRSIIVYRSDIYYHRSRIQRQLSLSSQPEGPGDTWPLFGAFAPTRRVGAAAPRAQPVGPRGAPDRLLHRSVAKRNCTDAASAQTEALQEPRCLAILRRLLRRSGVGYGRSRHRRILLFPDPCPMMSLWPDLGSRILYRPDPPVLFRRLDLCGGILHNLHRGSWRGLYGHGLCLRLLPWPPRLRIPSTSLRLAAERSRFDSDRQVRELQQFRRAPARRLSSPANPEQRRLIELPAQADRRQAEAPVFRPT